MFEQVAIEMFYERSVREHVALRALGFVVICYALVALGFVSLPFVLVWALALGAAETGVRLWGRRLQAAPSPRQTLAAHRELIAWAALLGALYVTPGLFILTQGAFAAGVSVAICAAVLLVICAQHNLTKNMFYSSGAVPAVGLMASMLSLGGPTHLVPTLALSLALIANARNLHHANAVTFKSLVGSKLETERANLRLKTALAAAREANAAKSTFLATMSHEIRTPLNGVIGMAESLSRADLDPQSAEAVSVIQRSGRALLAILNDILDLSKIEAGRLELQEGEFSLSGALQDVATLFGSTAAEKGVTLSVDVGAAAGVYLGDAMRVRQIVSNLLSNAVKFTEAGEVSLSAWARPGAGVRIVVTDSGIGVPPEKLAALFERFTQADGSITRRYGGTGLGLAICRELCELMGGRISAESTIGQGSRFTLDLPLTLVREESLREAAENDDLSLPRVQVLCAEDNPTNQLVLKTLLGHLGCEPTIAANGEEALALWRTGAWDVVLMDMQMPVMDGMTAMRAIRAEELQSGRPRTPLVAVTADALTDQVAAQKAAGADLHLAKPIEASALLETLAEALEIGAAARQAA